MCGNLQYVWLPGNSVISAIGLGFESHMAAQLLEIAFSAKDVFVAVVLTFYNEFYSPDVVFVVQTPPCHACFAHNGVLFHTDNL